MISNQQDSFLDSDVSHAKTGSSSVNVPHLVVDTSTASLTSFAASKVHSTRDTALEDAAALCGRRDGQGITQTDTPDRAATPNFTPIQASPRQSEPHSVNKYSLPNTNAKSTHTVSSFKAKSVASLTRTMLHFPHFFTLATAVANRADPYLVDIRSFAKPKLDPASVRCCPSDQWVPDTQVVNCMAPDCRAPFSMFTRKEHCKICGKVFCSSCCSNEVEIVDRFSLVAHSREVSGNIRRCDSSSGGGVFRVKSDAFLANEVDPTLLTTSTSTSRRSISLGSGSFSVPHTSVGHQRPPTLRNAPPTSPHASPIEHAGLARPVSPLKGVMCRVCNECFYETQLVISIRDDEGKPRRKSRGEFKMFQKKLLVNILSFLSLGDLLEAALVSSEFYFMSRDNVVWYQYNTARTLKEKDNCNLSLSGGANHMLSLATVNSTRRSAGSRYWGFGFGSYGTLASLRDPSTPAIALDNSATTSPERETPTFSHVQVIESAAALTEGEAFKRAISHHARYNYNQFLDFARRQEMARCEGLAWFSVATQVLLSGTIRVALIGPSGIGKTASVLTFLKKDVSATTVHPTMGFVRHRVTLQIGREDRVGVNLEIYDLSGEERYESLRRFICSHCHAIGLCYNPCHKLTLVQAADVMMGVEPALGPQPVVVCGLISPLEGGDARTESRKTLINPYGGGLLYGPSAKPPGSGNPQSSELGNLPPHIAFATAGGESYDAGATTSDSQGVASPSTILLNHASTAAVALGHSCHQGRGQRTNSSSNFHVGGFRPDKYSPLEVSEEDAGAITVREGGSLQCEIDHTHALYNRLLGSLIDRLSWAALANRTSISELTEPCKQSETTKLNANIVPMVSVTPVKRNPKVDKAIAEELLKLTMEPSVLSILLDR